MRNGLLNETAGSKNLLQIRHDEYMVLFLESRQRITERAAANLWGRLHGMDDVADARTEYGDATADNANATSNEAGNARKGLLSLSDDLQESGARISRDTSTALKTGNLSTVLEHVTKSSGRISGYHVQSILSSAKVFLIDLVIAKITLAMVANLGSCLIKRLLKQVEKHAVIWSFSQLKCPAVLHVL
jgi:hypothetical protein